MAKSETIRTYKHVLAITLFAIAWFTAGIVSAGQFKIVRVYDGVTVKAIDHDIEIKVRLIGIDAPET